MPFRRRIAVSATWKDHLVFPLAESEDTIDLCFSVAMIRPQSRLSLSEYNSDTSSDLPDSESSSDRAWSISPELVELFFRPDSNDTAETVVPRYDVSQLRSSSRDTVDSAIAAIIPGTSPERLCHEIESILETRDLPYSVDQVIESYSTGMNSKPAGQPITPLGVFTQAVGNIIAEELGHKPVSALPGEWDLESQRVTQDAQPLPMPSHWENRREVLGSNEMFVTSIVLGGVCLGLMMFQSYREHPDQKTPQASEFPYLLFHLTLQFMVSGIRAAVWSPYASRTTWREAAADTLRWGVSPIGTAMSEGMLFSLSEHQHAAGHRLSKWQQSAYVAVVSALGSLNFFDGWYLKTPIDSSNNWFNRTFGT